MRAALFLVSLFALAAPAAGAERFFVGSAPHFLVSPAGALAIADLNGDGRLDVAAAREGGGAVSLLENTGGPGAFAPPVELETGIGPVGLVSGDLDRDGLVDLVTVNAGSSTVTVLRNRGDGGFARGGDFPVGLDPLAIEIADLDGDSRRDLIVLESSGRKIRILGGLDAAGIAAFRRGDVDGNGAIQVADAIVIVGSLFQGAGALSCADAADADDDGRIFLTDAVYILLYQFLGGPPPLAPGQAECGHDPTADSLAACGSRCAAVR